MTQRLKLPLFIFLLFLFGALLMHLFTIGYASAQGNEVPAIGAPPAPSSSGQGDILGFLFGHPDLVVTGITAVLGFFGVKNWRNKVKASTTDQVDRWASTAAAAVVIGIKQGLFGSHEQAVTEYLRRLRVLAAAVGVEISPAHEARALALVYEQLVHAEKTALDGELDHLRAAGEATFKNMERLFPPKVPVPA